MGRLDDIIFRLSPQRIVQGIPVAVLLFSSREEQAAAFEKIEAAVELLRRHSPVRFAQVRRDLRRILVSGEPSAAGSYDARFGTCDLWFNWVLSPDTPPESVAGTIVHEAQHGRLCRLGFGYDAAVRSRIERICFRAARTFARRIPNGEPMVAIADAGMALGHTTYSAAAHFERQADSLDELKLPGWVHAALERMLRRRARRAAQAEASLRGRPTRRST